MITIGYRFKKHFNSVIDWQVNHNIEINKIIDLYNNWQIEDDFDKNKIKYLLAKIEFGKQIIGKPLGSESYYNELVSMEEFVKQFIDEI